MRRTTRSWLWRLASGLAALFSTRNIVTIDGTVPLGRVRAAALDPDGRTVVRTTVTGTTEILRIDDDLVVGEPVDLSTVAPSNPIVAFLD